ncbi:MAG: hypothetical protein GTO54_05205, partial [Nitrososphaeria archaeon]|nr:hypothetical protein [Nitrososphaeria archaeon]
MEEEIEKLYRKILHLAEEDKIVTLTRLVSRFGVLEKVKAFIILLFMAQREK